MTRCRAHAASARLPATCMPSQVTPPGITPGAHRLGTYRSGVTADEDDLWITRYRSPRRRRSDLADSSGELTVWWPADRHRRRTSAEERKRHGSTAVLRCHRR